MSTPSIRRTLLIRCGIGISLLLCAISATTYLLVRRDMFLEIDRSIEQTAALLANQVELENETITFEWQEGLGTNRALTPGELFQYWDETRGGTTRSPALHLRDLPKFCGINGAPLVRTIELPNGQIGRAIGLRIYPFVLPKEVTEMRERGNVIDPKSLPHILVVARDARPVHHTLGRLRWILGIGTLLTICVVYLIIHRAIRISLHPIDELAQQVSARAGRQLDSALDLPESLPAELKSLAHNFDSLLRRLAVTRDRERDFIRHAAHELRTPVAGLRATTELALSHPREPEEYRRHLTANLATAVELGELIKRLSALSRIGQSPSPPSTAPLDLAALFETCLSQVRPLFEEKSIRVPPPSSTPALMVLGDPALAKIILSNLIDNALSYCPAHGSLALTWSSSPGWMEMILSNSTESPPDDPDRWFEPLFRKESSRHDAEAHLGIGLTLSLDAATLMGWTLKARKSDSHTVSFILRAPLA